MSHQSVPDRALANLAVVDDAPIVLPSGFALEVATLIDSVSSVNAKFQSLADNTSKIAFNIFEVVDFRTFSGLVGEALVLDLSTKVEQLQKNPNIDGYPDLTDVSRSAFRKDFERWQVSDHRQFIKYPHGGIEVKNTFGTKKSSAQLLRGEERIEHINNKLDWKAHHRTTNSLLATLSDYVNACPRVVAVMYADTLAEEDWAKKQNPGKGSTMTSFSVIKRSGCDKLREGLRLCIDDSRYKTFLGIT